MSAFTNKSQRAAVPSSSSASLDSSSHNIISINSDSVMDSENYRKSDNTQPTTENKRQTHPDDNNETTVDDEDIALLDKILELQHIDQEFNDKNKQDQEKLNQVQGELEQQESLLLQLKDNLKAYYNMKESFEAMMIEFKV
jgi:hypothetical protein